MAQYQTADGRWMVGMVEGDSNYHGFLGWRDCVIQLTASGATERSVNYLNALRDYALYHNQLDEPIMPSNVNVWISNNGVTSAVQADDLSVSGNTFTIGGIKWTGSAWDYSNAGQSGGGGGSSGGGVLVVHDNDGTLDKTWQEIHDAMLTGGAVISNIEGSLVTAITGVGSLAPNRYVVESGGESLVTSTSDGYPSADGGQ